MPLVTHSSSPVRGGQYLISPEPLQLGHSPEPLQLLHCLWPFTPLPLQPPQLPEPPQLGHLMSLILPQMWAPVVVPSWTVVAPVAVPVVRLVTERADLLAVTHVWTYVWADTIRDPVVAWQAVQCMANVRRVVIFLLSSQ
jgi:hypothetical protein